MYLLLNFTDDEYGSNLYSPGVEQELSVLPMHSRPRKTSLTKSAQELVVSPIYPGENNALTSGCQDLNMSRMESVLTFNPEFAQHTGDPSSDDSSSSESDLGSDNDSHSSREDDHSSVQLWSSDEVESLDDDIDEQTLSASEFEEELEMPDPLDVNITDKHIDPMDINTVNTTQGEEDMDIRRC
ncbi:Hypothetical predicted protein [Paramuricea clavata]|uniref:Uncharacterized protein n=1 Tax=Paramuricea clavata TaxID=317549 RepID=A0A7D9D8Z1_PARCT|nr:Hypothetical predicted protein [Paramuricea clavata]